MFVYTVVSTNFEGWDGGNEDDSLADKSFEVVGVYATKEDANQAAAEYFNELAYGDSAPSKDADDEDHRQRRTWVSTRFDECKWYTLGGGLVRYEGIVGHDFGKVEVDVIKTTAYGLTLEQVEPAPDSPDRDEASQQDSASPGADQSSDSDVVVLEHKKSER